MDRHGTMYMGPNMVPALAKATGFRWACLHAFDSVD